MPPASGGAARDHTGDTGGAPERTRLSWRRTSLTASVVTILLARLALQHTNRAVAVTVAALTGLLWVLLVVLIQRRVHALPAALRSTAPLLLTTLACLVLGLLGVVLIVV